MCVSGRFQKGVRRGVPNVAACFRLLIGDGPCGRSDDVVPAGASGQLLVGLNRSSVKAKDVNEIPRFDAGRYTQDDTGADPPEDPLADFMGCGESL